ncbi:MAG: MogA/MoaB family molybdenum cofactor biosynthesis protein [Candidatus Acidiferrales bacterium]|jgi:molybdopterin adenylyltransferase
MRVAIVTVSDSVSAGRTEDRSGPALRERCEKLGWQVVSAIVVADEADAICALLSDLADSGASDLILTAGGTGIGPRDVTPEATAAVVQKLLPGVSEKMRAEGQKRNPRALLSRSVAGVRAQALIVNLPGSPRGAVESLDAIADVLPHAVDVLHGARHD